MCSLDIHKDFKSRREQSENGGLDHHPRTNITAEYIRYLLEGDV